MSVTIPPYTSLSHKFQYLLLLTATIGFWACSSSESQDFCDEEILPGAAVCLDFDNDERLVEYEQSIELAIREILPKINMLLPIKNIQIRVSVNPSGTIPELGIGGFNPNSAEVQLWIDPDFANLQESISKDLGPMLAHELHHAIRRKSVGYGSTLLEAMVSEGLADHFSIEVTAYDIPPWDRALSEVELEAWINSASESWNNGSYDHDKWFYGTDPEIPRWAGYSIGFKLVGSYISSHPGSKASELHSNLAASFVP